MSTRATSQLSVYKGDARIGQLWRTPRGAVFRYDADYLALPHTAPARAAVAFSLPLRPEAYEVSGVNLHPFFAGLLPEGLRLNSLVQRLKTSEDDLFSLLVASGRDAIGDISVAPPETAPSEQAPLVDIAKLDALSFEELFQTSLRESAREPAIAGVQPKLSAAMISFPIRAAHKRRAYILKLTPSEYPKLAENEAFFMQLTRRCGIPVANTRLVYDKTGRSGLLVERFDRVPRADGSFDKLHQEDACQLLDRYPADKYRLTLSDVARALEVCSAPIPERLKLLRLQALSYLIANGDLHAKNISIYVAGTQVSLTPCYDLLSTLPYGDRSMALSMEGRDDKLKAAHFVALGGRFGVSKAAVEQMLRRLRERVVPELARVREIGLEAKKTGYLAKVIRARIEDLSV